MELNLIRFCYGLRALFFYTVHEVLTASILGWFAIHSSSRLTGKVPDTEKDWEQKKRASENEMPGWYHWCNGHELGQILGDGERQGGLACCSPWGHKKLDMTRSKELKNSNKRFCSVPKRIFLTLKWLKYKWSVWRRLLWCSQKNLLKNQNLRLYQL